ACCTCATLLSAVPCVTSSSEKPLPDNRQLDCCGRVICHDCIQACTFWQKNPRFLSYCPYCPTSGPSLLTSRRRGRDGARHEKKENAMEATGKQKQGEPVLDQPPPPYTALSPSTCPSTIQDVREEVIIHHLRHTHPQDTLQSLALQYGIPPAVLRASNNLPLGADHLLAARHTLLIPARHCRNPTNRSPFPPEDSESLARKTAIRRWMVACKEANYDMALVYLDEAGYDLDEAVGRYMADTEWEARHP
ncbi:hypothetical protein N656DRAFT_677903, partial [Canariomyces notabilis]